MTSGTRIEPLALDNQISDPFEKNLSQFTVRLTDRLASESCWK